MIRRRLLALLVAALGFAVPAPVSFAQPNDAAPINIGLVKQFFNDLDDTLVEIATQPFGLLMKQTTGYEGKLSHQDDAFAVAKKLDKGQLQVGVFHGHEFAWLQKVYPKFRPLMVAVNQHNDVRAFILVNKNSTATSLKDLRGKNIDLPFTTKEHCCLYLNKACSDNAQQGAKTFFKSIGKSKSSIAAIDDVARGKLDAVLVDTITLEFYKSEKGPTFKNFIRVLAESHSFPAPVIVYKEGSLKQETISKFQAGLADAHKLEDGKDILTMWQIDRFQPVPDNYSKSLDDVRRLYPLPASIKLQATE
jgi:ABC-type phosphate/phosphonate transport system substrate-binding protein